MNDCGVVVPEKVCSTSSAHVSLDTAIRALLDPLWEALGRIDARLEAAVPASSTNCRNASEDLLPDATGDVVVALHRSVDQVERHVSEIRKQLNALIQHYSRPAAAVSDDSSLRSLTIDPDNCNAWERVLFDNELIASSALAGIRKELVDEICIDRTEAIAFAGQLLLVRAASIEELPELLHRVGEAYYRWQPRVDQSDDPMEQALAESLSRRAESVGLRNSIQLVRIGDRFDAARHISDGRGAEVTAVHGWIVLRENNKVYTKAGVSVK